MSDSLSVIVQRSTQATLSFFRVPANILSVLAILAVVIVPAIDKWLKADEALNAKIASLVEATHQLIQLNDASNLPMSSTLDPASAAKMQLALADREIQLNRATSLARSLGDQAYPAVLFALSVELCRDGRYPDAKRFLQGILDRDHKWVQEKRPNRDELAQAHVILAQCIVVSGVNGTALSQDQRAEFQVHMKRAFDIYAGDTGIHAQGEQANIQYAWAEMDRRLNMTSEVDGHQSTADTLAAAVRTKFPGFPVPSSSTPNDPPPILRDGDLPMSASGDTFKIKPVGRSDEIDLLLLPSGDKIVQRFFDAAMFRYEKGRFVGEYSVDTVTGFTTNQQFIVRWKKVLPESVDTKKLRPAMEWVIDDKTQIATGGVQQWNGLPPIRFSAERVVASQP
jgi:hypothetical protein